MALPNKKAWTEWNFNLRAATNNVNGVANETKYAINASIGGTTEDIWQAGGILQFLSSSEIMHIFSTSADDNGNPEGTGAHTITIFGVDSNYNVINETVTLNGTSLVLTTNSFLRINRMRVNTVGSGGANAGDITALAPIAATLQAQISVGSGSTFKSQYTVPDGYTAFLTSLTIGTDNNDRTLMDFQTRTENGPWITIYHLNINDNTFEQIFTIPIKITNKSDIRAQAVQLGGTGNISVTLFYEFYLIKNKYVTQNNFFSSK